jgi:hypothetical protein
VCRVRSGRFSCCASCVGKRPGRRVIGRGPRSATRRPVSR